MTGPILGFKQHGNGSECMLVLHDWLGDSTNYDALRPFLDSDAFTYAFINLRGYGASREMTGNYTVQEIAGDCLALADHLGWQRFHVMGHSMTGMITERLAANAPTRIKSAIAVCPISAAGNRLDASGLAFFKSTATDDEALRRLFCFVSSGLSDASVEANLTANHAQIAPACRLPYLTMLTAPWPDVQCNVKVP